MKYYTLIFILLFFNITNLFSATDSIKKELYEKKLSYVYQHIIDNNIKNFTLEIYPYRINLVKHDNKNSNINYINFDVSEVIKYCFETKQKKFYVGNEIYESIIYKSPSPNNAIFDKILLVRNKNKKIIWDCRYINGYNDSYVIDIKKYDNKLIIFYCNRGVLFVDFVYEYELPIIERSGLPFISLFYGEKTQYIVDNGQIISNNIIKFKFEGTDHIEYWKIRLTKKDYENFDKLKNESSLNINLIDNSHLLWYSNTLSNRKNFYKSYKNIDYFEQDTEPTIEQLKEKFPNDTFFTEPEAEQKSIINTTDSTSPGLWQKISFWCRNLISKFTV